MLNIMQNTEDIVVRQCSPGNFLIRLQRGPASQKLGIYSLLYTSLGNAHSKMGKAQNLAMGLPPGENKVLLASYFLLILSGVIHFLESLIREAGKLYMIIVLIPSDTLHNILKFRTAHTGHNSLDCSPWGLKKMILSQAHQFYENKFKELRILK